jgi:hypothetical protein
MRRDGKTRYMSENRWPRLTRKKMITVKKDLRWGRWGYTIMKLLHNSHREKEDAILIKFVILDLILRIITINITMTIIATRFSVLNRTIYTKNLMKGKKYAGNYLDEARWQRRKTWWQKFGKLRAWIDKETAFSLENVITLNTSDKGNYIKLAVKI